MDTGTILITLSVLLLVGMGMVKGYSLIADLKERTFRLEKKNGYEQNQINQLKEKVTELEEENKQLHQEIGELRTQLKRYKNKSVI